MSTLVEDAAQPRIYTTSDGRIAIEQSPDAVVVLPADQILRIIKELHVCYDYCAAWKEPKP